MSIHCAFALLSTSELEGRHPHKRVLLGVKAFDLVTKVCELELFIKLCAGPSCVALPCVTLDNLIKIIVIMTNRVNCSSSEQREWRAAHRQRVQVQNGANGPRESWLHDLIHQDLFP